MVVSLESFARSGFFGPLKIGSTREDAIIAFGNPEMEGPALSGKTVFFRYGSASFWWRTESDDLLKSISIEFPEIDSSPDPLSLEFLRPGIKLDESIELLRSRDMRFVLKQRRVKFDFDHVYLGVGVRLAFNPKPEPGWRTGLIGVEYAAEYLRP